jgi:DNA-binding winged helix-turn-helix (wHTH) protein/Tol biopolymer transport system component
MPLEIQSFEFEEYRLEVNEKLLSRRGEPVSLTPKTFQLLLLLVLNHGHLVEKDEIMNQVWPDSFVEEGNLSYTMRLLRKALGDDKQHPRFIETVPKAGYRFIAEVNPVRPQTPASERDESDPVSPPQKRYFLLTAGILVVVCLFGIAFMWFGGNSSYSPKQLRTGRLTTSGKITNATVSRSGNYLVFAQKEGSGESLWLRQIDSGGQTQILPPQDAEFVGLTISPDESLVYYSIFSKNAASLNLTRVPLHGGTPEPLPDIAADVSVSFSPDGKQFAFTESRSSVKETLLKTAEVDGSNQRLLLAAKNGQRSFPVFRANPVAWSPDGGTIACAVQETDKEGSSYRILLVDPENASERYLSDMRWHFIENIAWKDAENLVLIDVEPDSQVSQIWEISRTTGVTRKVTDGLIKYRWLGSADGKLFTVQRDIFSNLLVADFAQNSGEPQAKQIFSEAGLIENAVWSLDGKIFYNSWTSGKNEIWQIDPDGTAPRQLTANSNLIYDFAVSPIDNTLVFSALENGKVSLWSADAGGQNIRRLTDGPQDLSPSFSPDGQTIVFQRGFAASTLWSISLDGVSTTQLTGYFASHPAISPDGQMIAYHFMDYGGKDPHWKLGLINRETHVLLNKLDFPLPISQRKTAWRPKDGLLTMTFANSEKSGLLLLSPVDGTFRTFDDLSAGKISAFDWSSDSSRLAFAQNFETNNVVLLSGF